jgi:dCMP deaminase
MNLAEQISYRSTCSNPDRKVGCVIVDDSYQKVLAWGYNGVAKGENHACEYDPAKVNENGYRCSCVHAEQNALVKMNSFETCNKIMYVTLSPCMICARLIINAGIDTVVAGKLYKDTSPIDLLLNSGVKFKYYELS